MIFIHFKVNNMLKKCDNLAMRANFVTWCGVRFTDVDML